MTRKGAVVMATLIGSAMSGTLDEFKAFYAPGTANTAGGATGSLLSEALGDNDPARRAEKALFLLDDGADAGWRDDRLGYNLLHILLGHFRGNTPRTDGDLAVLRRLLDAGADVNAIDKKRGTPLHQLISTSIGYSEDSLDPVYDLLFGRSNLDLFGVSAREHSVYGLAHNMRDRLPNLWRYVERYVQDHGLVVPESEREA